MKKLKVLLTYPFWEYNNSWGKLEVGAGNFTFSYGLAMLAAVSRENGFFTKVYDTQLYSNREQFKQFLIKNQFDVIGMTVYTYNFNRVAETVKFCHEILPQSKIILGGCHATANPRETINKIKFCDFVVMGEGEETFVELLNILEKDLKNFKEIKGLAFKQKDKIVINKKRELIKDLNKFPIPAYDLFPMKKYISSPNVVLKYPTYDILLSRGCPFNCTFCEFKTVLGQKYRTKSINKIIREVKYLKKEFGARGLVFRDSSITTNKEFIIQLCNRMIKENLNLKWACQSRVDTINESLLLLMKKAGCWQISFGCESGNQKTLDLIKKGTTVEQNEIAVKSALKAGLSVSTNWMICMPGENKKDVLNTINFACKLGAHVGKFFLPVPYPKTTFYKDCLEEGGIKDKINYDDFNMMYPNRLIYVNKLIGEKEMLKLLRYAYQRYYSSPKVIWRNLKMLKDKDTIKKYFNAIKIILNISR